MSCPACKGIGFVLYKEPAPSPPYKQDTELEFAKRCVCQNATKRPTQNHENHQNEI
jgi:hypothetical protein